jgi:hypothetical protein
MGEVPTMMLECAGVFTAPFVPDGWTASGRPGEFYELVAPDGAAAIYISVYQRPDRPMEEHEARDALLVFLTKSIKSSGGEIRVLRDGPQQRAFSRSVKADKDGNPREWFAACIMWPQYMLLCTYNAAPDSGHFPAAERMIASIFPTQAGRPRRWFRRR